MAKHIIIILTLCLIPLSVSSAQDDYWGTIDRGSSTRIGDYEFYRDGTSSTRIGNTHFYQGGSVTTMDGYKFRDR